MKKLGGGKGGAPPSSGGAQAKASSTGSSSSSGNKVYDKKDTNNDGTVSVQGEIAYDLKYPEEAENATGKQKNSAGYVQHGNLNVCSRGTPSLFSLNA